MVVEVNISSTLNFFSESCSFHTFLFIKGYCFHSWSEFVLAICLFSFPSRGRVYLALFFFLRCRSKLIISLPPTYSHPLHNPFYLMLFFILVAIKDYSIHILRFSIPFPYFYLSNMLLYAHQSLLFVILVRLFISFPYLWLSNVLLYVHQDLLCLIFVRLSIPFPYPVCLMCYCMLIKAYYFLFSCVY